MDPARLKRTRTRERRQRSKLRKMCKPFPSPVVHRNSVSGKPAANINDLPDEMLMQVFGWLNTYEKLRVRCVCIRWSFVASESIQLVDRSQKNAFSRQTAKLLQRMPRLHTLMMRDCTLDSFDISRLTSCCSGISCLNLNGSTITDDAIQRITHQCTRLRSLHIGWTAVTNIGLEYLARNCPQLRLLDVTRCDASVSGLLQLPTSLQSLTAMYIQLSAEDIAVLAGRFTQLTTLNVTGNAVLSDASFHALGQHCPQLRVLQCAGCCKDEVISEQAMYSLAAGCSSLTTLNISDAPLLQDDAVIALTQRCTSLLDLDLSGAHALTDAAAMALANSCSRLQVLRLNGCAQIGRKGLMAIASHCEQLTELNLTDCAMDDEAALAIASSCARLVALHISYTSDHSLAVICAYLQHLSTLQLSDANVTEEGLRSVERLPRLRWLWLTNCTRVTEVGIRSLNVSACIVQDVATNRTVFGTCNKCT